MGAGSLGRPDGGKWTGGRVFVVDTAESRLECEWAGAPEGPWLVCLHSIGTDRSIWREQVERLGRGHRLLGIDLRGHGGSGATPPPYGIDQLVDDVVAVLDAVRIPVADIMGISLGGIVALGLALRFPERVARIVVADARVDVPAAYVQLWAENIALAERGDLDVMLERALRRWFTPAYRRADEATVARLRAIGMRTSIAGLVGCARALQSISYLGALGRIGCPALFVVGAEDQATTPAVMAEMATWVAGARLVVLPGAGHLSVVERPGLFAESVMAFLEEAHGAAP